MLNIDLSKIKNWHIIVCTFTFAVGFILGLITERNQTNTCASFYALKSSLLKQEIALRASDAIADEIERNVERRIYDMVK